MLEGAVQILEHTNCLANGGAWLLPCSPCALPHCYCLTTCPSPIAGILWLG